MPRWGDCPLAIVGAGASLKGIDLSQLRGRCRVLAVKAAIFDLPWATAGFGLDSRRLAGWWPHFVNDVTMPVYWCMPDARESWPKGPVPHCMRLLRRLSGPGLSDDPGAIYGGGTSGYGALGLAYLKGARKVVLFGYDYGPSGGAWHFNEQVYASDPACDEDRFMAWAGFINVLLTRLEGLGMRIVNASPASRVTAVERVTPQRGIRIARSGD